MIWKILIIIFLIMCFVGAELRTKTDITLEQLENMTNKTSYDNLNFTNLREEGDNQNNTFLARMIYKFADFMAFVSVEGFRVALNFGYRNPQYNFNLMWKLMFISIFAFCIIPLIYLLLFIGYGIYIIVNWVKSKCHKKKK